MTKFANLKYQSTTIFYVDVTECKYDCLGLSHMHLLNLKCSKIIKKAFFGIVLVQKELFFENRLPIAEISELDSKTLGY